MSVPLHVTRTVAARWRALAVAHPIDYAMDPAGAPCASCGGSGEPRD